MLSQNGPEGTSGDQVYDQDLIGEYDLLASKDIKKVNIFTRLMKSLNYLIWGDV